MMPAGLAAHNCLLCARRYAYAVAFVSMFFGFWLSFTQVGRDRVLVLPSSL